MQFIVYHRRWSVRMHWLLICLLGFVLLCGLAMWQWQRAHEKQAVLDRIQQLQSQPPLRHLPNDHAKNNTIDGATLNFHARWLAPAVWLLDNQMHKGRPGYDVIIPVRPLSADQVVFVNLGWVGAPLARTELPPLEIPQELEIYGMLRTKLSNFRVGANTENQTTWPRRIQTIDINERKNELIHALQFSPIGNNPQVQRIKLNLYSGMIYQTKNSPYQMHYQPIVVSPQRHRAYAAQWALLALALLVIALATAQHPLRAPEEHAHARTS